MKNLIPALVFLGIAICGFTVVIFQPDQSGERPSPPTKAALSQLTDFESTQQEAAAGPQIACNAMGLPIPVISETSELHDPAVAAFIKSKISPAITKDLLTEESKTSLTPASVDGMVWIPGGVGIMGSDVGPPDEMPPHAVAMDGFWMDKTEVTNREFKKFVDATGYITLPERKPELRSIQPGSKLEQLAILEEFNQPGSICSLQLGGKEDIDPAKGAYSWWQYLPGANWKHPEGPDSSIEDRMDHPVVHVSWIDATEYCKWAGKQLPTEAQWEFAARAGQDGNFYPWGNERNPGGEWKQNIWQGTFPLNDTGEDGFKTTAPVAKFEANGFGLYDMSGNVWEWCADYYQPEYYAVSPQRNPPGPDSSFDPQEPGIIKRVQRGGSFMCSDEYCVGYRVSARMKGEEDTGAFHTGFRCVVVPSSSNDN